MTARIQWLTFGTLLVLAAACTRPGGDAADGASATNTVDRAVAVARAIRADPPATDSILGAHGLSRAQFDALLYDIASDAALAGAYAEAIR